MTGKNCVFTGKNIEFLLGMYMKISFPPLQEKENPRRKHRETANFTLAIN